LILTVAWTATVVGCGSESTGRTSVDAVSETAHEFGGPNVKLYASDTLVRSVDGEWRHVTVITACKPEGGCTIIAPDGVSYPDVQHFVDDNKVIKPGEKVVANANLGTPDKPLKIKEFTKSTGRPWVRYAGAAALAVVVLLVGVGLIPMRRRRREEQDLLRAWEEPVPGDPPGDQWEPPPGMRHPGLD
jgi:hypothetical protein